MSTLPPGTFGIDRDGVWRHEGQEVTHPGVLRNLYANLRVEGGAHYLQVGPARIPVDVADARYRTVHDGQTYYFCSAGCLDSFEADPARYLAVSG